MSSRFKSRSRAAARRSSCPINASLELLGDRWTLLIVRDLMFAGFRSYKELSSSEEGIATNILADRLAHLEAEAMITSERDPEDGRRLIYRLTAKGLDLAPVLLELSRWAVAHEAGVRPPDIFRRWEADRAGVLAELRRQWLKEEKRREGSPRRKRRSG
jgi:DNA-binding HxlR family transcriptional regulator